MTERLYYNDSTLLEFDARIVETNRQKKQWSTVLDRSAFYPTSGGQSHDTGFLNDIPVIDVTEHSDGSILHITAESPGEAGQSVHGVVDSMRRLRNRQSHTAQHILSQAFIQICEAETVAVHLGEDYCS
ncbi:MAG: alanyl-tRNA editing protein, partial [Proteobacteria bacterium]|nr:alanyl-tRNA editing protein [Pseudomonadota bacterium]